MDESSSPTIEQAEAVSSSVVGLRVRPFRMFPASLEKLEVNADKAQKVYAGMDNVSNNEDYSGVAIHLANGRWICPAHVFLSKNEINIDELKVLGNVAESEPFFYNGDFHDIICFNAQAPKNTIDPSFKAQVGGEIDKDAIVVHPEGRAVMVTVRKVPTEYSEVPPLFERIKDRLLLIEEVEDPPALGPGWSGSPILSRNAEQFMGFLIYQLDDVALGYHLKGEVWTELVRHSQEEENNERSAQRNACEATLNTVEPSLSDEMNLSVHKAKENSSMWTPISNTDQVTRIRDCCKLDGLVSETPKYAKVNFVQQIASGMFSSSECCAKHDEAKATFSFKLREGIHTYVVGWKENSPNLGVARYMKKSDKDSDRPVLKIDDHKEIRADHFKKLEKHCHLSVHFHFNVLKKENGKNGPLIQLENKKIGISHCTSINLRHNYCPRPAGTSEPRTPLYSKDGKVDEEFNNGYLVLRFDWAKCTKTNAQGGAEKYFKEKARDILKNSIDTEHIETEHIETCVDNILKMTKDSIELLNDEKMSENWLKCLNLKVVANPSQT